MAAGRPLHLGIVACGGTSLAMAGAFLWGGGSAYAVGVLAAVAGIGAMLIKRHITRSGDTVPRSTAFAAVMGAVGVFLVAAVLITDVGGTKGTVAQFDPAPDGSDPSFESIPPLLDEVPAAAASEYFTALFQEDYDRARTRVAASCAPTWDGGHEIEDLVSRGVLERPYSGRAPLFADFSGHHEDLERSRRRFVFTRNGFDIETIWIMEDERWKIVTCPDG